MAEKFANSKKSNDKKFGYRLSDIVEGLLVSPKQGITELEKVIVNLDVYDSKVLKHKLEVLKPEPPAIFKKLSHIEYALKHYKIYRQREQ